MPDQPILIYIKLSAPVFVPPTTPVETITLDKWLGQGQTVFAQRRFVGFAAGQRVAGFVEAPFVPDLSTWQSIRTHVFTRRPFLLHETHEIPRIPTAPPGETITLDKWCSQDLARFTRQQFAGLIAGQHVTGFVESPFAPDLPTWQSRSTPPVFTRRHFLLHETHELPRLPILPVVPDLPTWQSRTTPFVFIRRHFLLHETHELPRLPPPPAPVTLDEWQSRSGVLFNRRLFLRDPQAQTLLDIIIPPPITFPLVLFHGISQGAGLVSTQDLITWAGLSQSTAGMSPTRAMQVDGVSQHAALVAAIDLLTWAGLSQPTQLTSQARGGG